LFATLVFFFAFFFFLLGNLLFWVFDFLKKILSLTSIHTTHIVKVARIYARERSTDASRERERERERKKGR